MGQANYRRDHVRDTQAHQQNEEVANYGYQNEGGDLEQPVFQKTPQQPRQSAATEEKRSVQVRQGQHQGPAENGQSPLRSSSPYNIKTFTHG
mmetsp:Transcript_10060/g.16960  ORF Transcript_10060/g.16960 Transcript_10060/m.16960 type:complete len:92 (+) Transcript_10060:774-1049(+)